RQGTLKPKLVPKYVRRLPGFNNKVLSLFAKGMSVRNIRDTVEELYGIAGIHELLQHLCVTVIMQTLQHMDTKHEHERHRWSVVDHAGQRNNADQEELQAVAKL
ncbi:MAG: transposase, partial [Gammaproteobacteria bacterium]|nr:transposase [Gammaproteobacteria bacterium]